MKDYRKWKITAMLHQTQEIILRQMEVENDAINNQDDFIMNTKTY